MEKREKAEICDQHADAEAISSQCRASLQGRLAHVGRVLAHRQQEALASLGLDLRSYATLVHLEHAPCATQLDLAKQSRVDKSTLVAILDMLEKAGWVERLPDARDRRVRIVRATVAGKKVLAAAHMRVRGTEEGLLQTLEPPMRDAFVAALGALASMA